VHGILQITHYGPWWGFPYYNLTAPVEIVPLYPRWAGLHLGKLQVSLNYIVNEWETYKIPLFCSFG
jgi:hypothetical protein